MSYEPSNSFMFNGATGDVGVSAEQNSTETPVSSMDAEQLLAQVHEHTRVLGAQLSNPNLSPEQAAELQAALSSLGAMSGNLQSAIASGSIVQLASAANGAATGLLGIQVARQDTTDALKKEEIEEKIRQMSYHASMQAEWDAVTPEMLARQRLFGEQWVDNFTQDMRNTHGTLHERTAAYKGELKEAMGTASLEVAIDDIANAKGIPQADKDAMILKLESLKTAVEHEYKQKAFDTIKDDFERDLKAAGYDVKFDNAEQAEAFIAKHMKEGSPAHDVVLKYKEPYFEELEKQAKNAKEVIEKTATVLSNKAKDGTLNRESTEEVLKRVKDRLGVQTKTPEEMLADINPELKAALGDDMLAIAKQSPELASSIELLNEQYKNAGEKERAEIERVIAQKYVDNGKEGKGTRLERALEKHPELQEKLERGEKLSATEVRLIGNELALTVNQASGYTNSRKDLENNSLRTARLTKEQGQEHSEEQAIERSTTLTPEEKARAEVDAMMGGKVVAIGSSNQQMQQHIQEVAHSLANTSYQTSTVAAVGTQAEPPKDIFDLINTIVATMADKGITGGQDVAFIDHSANATQGYALRQQHASMGVA